MRSSVSLLLPLLPVLAAATPAARASAAPTQPLVVVERPWATGVAFFRDELDRVRARAHAFLSAQRAPGFTLVDLDRLEALDELEEQGRLDPGGPVCRLPPLTSRLVEHQFPGSARASVTVSCGEGCRLRVAVGRQPLGQRYEPLAEWRAELPADPDVDDVLAAFGRLAPPPPEPAGGLGLLGRTDDEQLPLVRLLDASPSGPWGGSWGGAPWSDERFHAHQATFDRCHEGGWSSGSSDTLRVAFAPSGRVARCESARRQTPRLACLCRAARAALDVGEGAEGRRVELKLMNRLRARPPGPSTHARVENRQTADEGLSLAIQTDDVAACFAAAGLERARRRVRFDIGADGTILDGELVGDSAQTTPASLPGCVRAALLASHASCPASGRPTRVEADVVVYTLRPAPPPAGPSPRPEGDRLTDDAP